MLHVVCQWIKMIRSKDITTIDCVVVMEREILQLTKYFAEMGVITLHKLYINLMNVSFICMIVELG